MTPEERLQDVLARIADAERRAKRRPQSVTLVAVSKTFDAEAIRRDAAAAIDALWKRARGT